MKSAFRYLWLLMLLLSFACGEEKKQKPKDEGNNTATTDGGNTSTGEDDSDTNNTPVQKDDNDNVVVIPPASTDGTPYINLDIFPKPGATDFITANEKELTSAYNGPFAPSRNGGYNAQDSLSDSSSKEMAGSPSPEGDAPPSNDTNAGQNEPVDVNMPTPDPNREIVEADIFKVDGDHLYIMNAYRGFVIIDVSQVDHPKITGRYPFQAQPVEMYVRDNRAYVISSDYFEYWMYDEDSDPLGFHGSQVLILDITDPANPEKLGSMAVEGEITDTRMVGDVLYVVSKRQPEYWRYNTIDWEDNTWVASLNIADPSNIQKIDQVEFPGTSTLIHVAPHAIFVAAVDPNYYLYDEFNEQESLVTYVDISNANGDILSRGSIYVPGYIQDKFKLDYFDKTLRVFSQQYWSGKRYLTNIDVSKPDTLTIAAKKTIFDTYSNYGDLQATRFDEGVGYALFRNWYNDWYNSELLTLDLADPKNPLVTDNHTVEGYVTHLETRDDRLIALGGGRTKQQCDYAGYYDCYYYHAKVWLFNTADIHQIADLSSVNLEKNSWSEAQNDYKAFKVVDSLNVILLPISYWDNNYSHQFNGSQIIEWKNDTLKARGQIAQVDTVRRVVPVKDRLVAISESQIQVIDAQNLDKPIITSALYLQRNVLDIFEIGGKQIQLLGADHQSGLRIEVIEFGKDDNPAPISTLKLPFNYQPVVFKDGNYLHMIGWEEVNGNHQQMIRTADFTDPANPSLRGKLALTEEFARVYNSGMGFYYYYWSPFAGLPLKNQFLPVTSRALVRDQKGRRDYQSYLQFLDMRDPDYPQVLTSSIAMPEWPFVNKVTHGDIMFSSHVEETKGKNGNTLFFHVKSFVDRIDFSDPQNPKLLDKVSVPGWLIDVSNDGKLLYTIDYQWDEFGRRRNSFNVLALDAANNIATLKTVLPVGDQIHRGLYRDKTIWIASHKYPWWGVHSDTLESRQPYTNLIKVVLDNDGDIAENIPARVSGYHFDLLDLQGDAVFLASDYPSGVLSLNVADMNATAILNSARTLNYVSKILVNNNFIYMPLGYYGVHRTPAN